MYRNVLSDLELNLYDVYKALGMEASSVTDQPQTAKSLAWS